MTLNDIVRAIRLGEKRRFTCARYEHLELFIRDGCFVYVSKTVQDKARVYPFTIAFWDFSASDWRFIDGTFSSHS